MRHCASTAPLRHSAATAPQVAALTDSSGGPGGKCSVAQIRNFHGVDINGEGLFLFCIFSQRANANTAAIVGSRVCQHWNRLFIQWHLMTFGPSSRRKICRKVALDTHLVEREDHQLSAAVPCRHRKDAKGDGREEPENGSEGEEIWINCPWQIWGMVQLWSDPWAGLAQPDVDRWPLQTLTWFLREFIYLSTNDYFRCH